MRIQEALDRIDMMRPNMVKKEFKIAALSELDGRIWTELVNTHGTGSLPPMTMMEQIINLSPEDRTIGTESEAEEEETFSGYSTETDPGTELLAPFPYDEVYLYWLASKVDFQNLEMDKYNNDRIMFNTAWNELSDWYTRTHMPKQRTRELRL